MFEDYTLADAQIVETMETQSGIAMEGAMGQPFDDDGHGEHCLAVQNVGAEERVIIDGQVQGKCFRQDLGAGNGRDGGKFTGSTGNGNNLDWRTRGSNLANEEIATGSKTDQADPFAGENFFREGVTMLRPTVPS